MGLLVEGEPLKWNDSKKYLEYVKEHGLIQFINTYNSLKDLVKDEFKWGDEIEMNVVKFINDEQDKDDEKDTDKHKVARLSLRCGELLQDLRNKQKEDKDSDYNKCNFLPEYGRFMIEATPSKPYGNYTGDLALVQKNMQLRRDLIRTMLKKGETLVTLSNFPMMGVGKFTYPYYKPTGSVAKSEFLPDELINEHPRFATLTQNIRTRRGSKVDIRLPVFKDKNTSKDFKELTMDAMGFGMGCSCLQVTFQARTIDEARRLYDQLNVISPILMALTASTPFHRGTIVDTDSRWTVISQAVDDRTPEERGLVKDSKEQRLYKSRYDSISTYIAANDPHFTSEYNDIELPINKKAYDNLIDAKIDKVLARHIAGLWVRDPLVIYNGHVELDDEKSTEHFENIQSTNWQSVRFKPPPVGSDIGWRTEFRTMEIQMTDFENAAFSVFIALISRALLYFELNFYIPISKVDENMKTAHHNNACQTEEFWFRNSIKKCAGVVKKTACGKEAKLEGGYMQKRSVEDIICGKACFPGLVPIVASYLDVIKCNGKTRVTVDRYLEFIKMRAKGKLLTAAQWMRKFVMMHPDYKQDSKLNETICRDIIIAADEISKNEVKVPQLLGKFQFIKDSDEEIDDNVELGSIRDLDLEDKNGCKIFYKHLSNYQNC